MTNTAMTMTEPQPAAPQAKRCRFQYGVKHLLIGTAVVALLLGIWMGYIRKAVDFRKADPSDPTYERYLGFGPEDMKARNILIATGHA